MYELLSYSTGLQREHDIIVNPFAQGGGGHLYVTGVRKYFLGANPKAYHITWMFMPLSNTRLDLCTPKPYLACLYTPISDPKLDLCKLYQAGFICP